MGGWYCYILRNNCEDDENRTYNGATNNPSRRIRQHNQEIKGGARYTKRYGSKCWEIYALVYGFPDKINALQCEWRIKHPDNARRRKRKYNSPKGRVIGLNEVLHLNKWTSNSTHKNTDTVFRVWVCDEFRHLLKDLPHNIIFEDYDELININKKK